MSDDYYVINMDEDDLAHYGILRRSGRYPWGSGGNVVSRSMSFIDHLEQARQAGLSDTEIARGFGMTSTELRNTITIARNAKKQADIAQAVKLKDRGWSNVAIGERMGINESSVRSLLKSAEKDKEDILKTTSDLLRERVGEKGLIDVGSGVELHMGVSKQRLQTALAMLKDEGYEVHTVKIEQLGTGHKTEFKVLAPPGTTQKDVFLRRAEIRQIRDYSEDGGRTYSKIQDPVQVSLNRVKVRYAEEGGKDADGMIYVRPGVKDLDMGGSRYAQVRIAVNGTHYLKGMAVYKDDLPRGIDLEFNTNKSDTGNKLDAMKALKSDPDNPFGSVVRQIGERDIHGRLTKVTSALNLVNEQGDWSKWSKNLSSQMLSKQSPALAKKQLDLKLKQKQEELDEILALTNPTVKKKLLELYADGADSSAVTLKAAAMDRQGTHVLIPIRSLKETEIHAPNYRDGEQVVLIRYPHGGIFEIPELTVNNRNREAVASLGRDTKDAVGINPRVAERLSGADFDGDTVLVIPQNAGSKIKTAPALAGLKNFDPQRAYPGYPGMKVMSEDEKGTEMGKVSNLITDMTIKGANPHELAAAVRHSMVVIDAAKHKLNYKQSALDNGIANLKEKYQKSDDGGRGASTIISRASADLRVPERVARPAKKGGPINPKTGERVYEPTGRSYVDKDGKTVMRTTKTTKLAEAKDAHTLSSGTKIESIYADHSNRLKALANEARLESLNVKAIPYSPSAARAYSKEVTRLTEALNLALRNSPLERQAQVVANATFQAKRQANPGMSKEEIKKLKYLALDEARTRVGAKKDPIEISDREWEAIQAGAVSPSKLGQILNHAKPERVKELATPKATILMSPSNVARAKALAARGATQAEIASALGVSLTTLKKSLEE